MNGLDLKSIVWKEFWRLLVVGVYDESGEWPCLRGSNNIDLAIWTWGTFRHPMDGLELKRIALGPLNETSSLYTTVNPAAGRKRNIDLTF
ncbi:MAG: hypothetical protein ACREDR_02705 [Blastocatellia bacterium]